jgi:hypothetical protein
MEIWGIGCFDNDSATKWAFQLVECSNLSVITRTLDLAKNTASLDSENACKVLAAIETVAKLKGEMGDKTLYSTTVDEWVKSNPMRIDQAIIHQALEAIEVITDPDSDLLALWEKKDDFVNWMKELELLRDRLMA